MATSLEARLRIELGRARTAAGLSLQQLADRSEVSASTLSRLETGDRRITVELLDTVADALDTSAVALLAEAAREDRLFLPTPTVELSAGMSGVILRTEDDGRQLIRITIPQRRRLPDLMTHPGSEWFHVLRGRIRLRVGDRDVVVEPGQTVQFDTTQPHAFGGLDGPAEILSRFEPGTHR
ncbi:helix-turn-helix domain-containing protein [Euzebya tangerina]|uniref:helix-turn-helix domain-containing protein n=1 Tax=Euzebya tangerina TaxID=591198 RepID=UPI000E30CC84|nr:XRE family transcriptional regulator [Euzebya tangerina]